MGKGRPKGRKSKTLKSSNSEDDDIEFDSNKLTVVVEGESKSFSEWTLEYARYYYPDVGRKTYRVPPVDFNTQPLTEVSQLDYAQLGTPKEEYRKKDRSQADVGYMFEELGRQLETSEDIGRGLFIVTSTHYENYLSDLRGLKTKGKQPPLPCEVASRGELDLLVLHNRVGIVMVQVKGVGLQGSWKPSDGELQAAIEDKVKDACNQLKRDELVLQHILKDLQLKCNVHRVVALPYVSVSQLKTCDSFTQESFFTFLCSNHIASSGDMLSWWLHLNIGDDSSELDDFQFQSIVGRYCGLLSTVSVWCKSSPRVEVRDMAEAADEVGARFSRIVLTAQQQNAIDCQHRLVFLHGPPGSGKSVMLVIKARQWLLEGHDVCVLNLEFGKTGNPVGHYIHNGIVQWRQKISDVEQGAKSSFIHYPQNGKSGCKEKVNDGCGISGKILNRMKMHVPQNDITNDRETAIAVGNSEHADHIKTGSGTTDYETSSSEYSSAGFSSDAESSTDGEIGHVFRIDSDLGMNFNGDQATILQLLQKIQENMHPGVPCHFIWDEFYWKDLLMPILDALRTAFPQSCIWCAEISADKAPASFTNIMLNTVLRCPPTVQAVLQHLEWVKEHKALYTVDSTVHGLPTDGFKPQVIEHKLHHATSPLDCSQCADQLLDFFRTELKLHWPENLDLSCTVVKTAHPETDFNTSSEETSSSVFDSLNSTSGSSTVVSNLAHIDPLKTLSIPKSKKKKACCLPRRVKFSDIVVLCAYARNCVNRTNNLLIVKDNTQDIHHDRIENSVFFKHIKKAGLPAVFCAPNVDAQDIALPKEDKVLFSVTNAVNGLERKVVVYVPCESNLYEYPVERQETDISTKATGSPESCTPAGCTEQQLTSEEADAAVKECSMEPIEQKFGQSHIDGAGCDLTETHSVLTGSEMDMIQKNSSPFTCIGGMDCERAAMSSTKKPKHQHIVHDIDSHPVNIGDAEKPSSRMQATSPADNGSDSGSDSVIGGDSGSDSVSSLPGQSAVSARIGLTEEEWAKIQERMLEQNQKGMFYAASRCLSVFVLIIP